MIRKETVMNIALIITGSLLLIVPNVTFFDILPDFIGYAMIMHALKKASFVCYDIKDSYSMFRNLLWVNAARIPFYFVFAMFPGDSTLLLLFNFIFSAVESFMLIRAFLKLFDGLSYLAMRNNEDKSDIGSEYTAAVFNKQNEIRYLTVGFIIAKALLVLLPDLSVLSSTEYGTVSSSGIVSISQFHVIFMSIGVALSLAISIFWFIRFRKFFNGVKSDSLYLAGIDDRYEEFIGKDPFAVLKSNLFLFFVLISAGAAFSIGLRLDGINIIPEFIGAAFLTFAALSMMSYYKKNAKRALIYGIVYTVGSLGTWIYRFVFIRTYFSEFMDSEELGLAESLGVILEAQMRRSFAARYAFAGFIAVSVLEAVLFILFIIVLEKLFAAVINEHTEYVVHSYEGDEKNGDVSEQTTASLLKLLRFSTVCGILSAVVSASESFLCILFPAVWIPEIILKAIWMGSLIILTARTKSAVKKKYYL